MVALPLSVSVWKVWSRLTRLVALPPSVYVVMLLSDGHRPDVADIPLVDAESGQLLGSLLRLRQELNRRRQRVHEV